MVGYWMVSLAALLCLENPSFESGDPLVAWRTWIYKDGRDPAIRVDSSVAKEGKQSLLVEAQDPADVALGQTISLPAGSVWRVKCWVKTEGLVARDRTDVGGTVHVQIPEGATLAKGLGQFGTSPWREVDVPFRVASAGQVKICLFYIGYGKGTGKVWFDDVRLEEVRAEGPQEARIHSRKLTEIPVDPKQCGQFIEPLCHLIPSMLAQQVASTSFEEETAWNVTYKKEIDRPFRPWYPDGAVHVASFSYDAQNPFNGKRSQKIELPAARCRAGISQDGYCVKEGLTYRLRLHMMGKGNVPVRGYLHGGGRIVAGPEALGRAGDAWEAAEVKLRAVRSMENVTLTIDFEGPGTLWIDRVSLIGEDAVLGLWRPDVVKALRDMSPGAIRFGGSALESYEWEKCVGPWDERTPFVQGAWGGVDENFVGVEEFVQLCREVGAEPLVCVRWSGKKPEDAAAEVEYFNGAPSTRLGALRAKNGHPEPYRVKYWQIGNEVAGPEYEASLRSFAEAMRAADPSVRLLSSFPSAETLRKGGGMLDYLCPHHYGCADLGAMEEDFKFLRAQIGGSKVRVAVTEWNTTAGNWGLERGMLQTLSNALSCARYHNLMARQADLVEIAIRSNLVDSFGSGAILTGPGWLYVSPAYHAQRLYARAAGSFPLWIERRPELPWSLEEPDLCALWSADRKVLRIFGVNSTERAIEVKVSLAGLPGATGGLLHVLKDSEGALSPEVMNSRDDPERIRIFTEKFQGKDLRLRCEPLSLTLLELEMGS